MKSKNIEIIIIDDNPDIIEIVEFLLSNAGYSVTSFSSTDNVEQFLEEENPKLMIVDRNLPGVEGSEFVAYIRKCGYDIPVIFLTARDKESDLEEGFTRGGDDYITKPFNNMELLLRVEALLRRSGKQINNKIKYKDIVLDIEANTLSINGKFIKLTKLEFKLLYTFVNHPHHPLDRDFLREEVWGDDSAFFNDKTINVAMNRLKKKIDPNREKKYFAPVWGVGYKLL